jgi:hypothetical protein
MPLFINRNKLLCPPPKKYSWTNSIPNLVPPIQPVILHVSTEGFTISLYTNYTNKCIGIECFENFWQLA